MEVLLDRNLRMLKMVRADEMDGSDVGMSWDLDSVWIGRNTRLHLTHHFCLLRRLVSHDSVDRAHTRDIFLAADVF